MIEFLEPNITNLDRIPGITNNVVYVPFNSGPSILEMITLVIKPINSVAIFPERTPKTSLAMFFSSLTLYRLLFSWNNESI